MSAMVFPEFSRLPDDLCTAILTIWLFNTEKTMISLDIAFCNRLLRPQYMHWIRNHGVSLFVTRIKTSSRLLVWLASRRLVVTDLTINDQFVYAAEYQELVTMARLGVFNTVKALVYDGYQHETFEEVFRHLPELTSLRSFTTPKATDNYLRLIQQLPHPEKLVHIPTPYELLSTTDHEFYNLTTMDVGINVEERMLCAFLRTISRLQALTSVKLSLYMLGSVDSYPLAVKQLLNGIQLPASLTSIHIKVSNMFRSATINYKTLYTSILHMLSAVPNLSELSLETNFSEHIATSSFLWKLCEVELCRLTQFKFYHGVFISMTAYTDTLAIDWASWSRVHESVSTHSVSWSTILHALQFSRSQSFILQFSGAWNSRWDRAVVSSWSKVTEISLRDLFPWATPVAVALWSLPSLNVVHISTSTEVSSLAAGLQLCVDEEVQSHSVQELHFGESSNCDPVVSLLPSVCPKLRKLHCGDLSPDVLVQALCSLSTLTYIRVAFATIERMTAEHWKAISAHSKCRWWEAWSHDESVWRPAINCMFENVEGVKVRLNSKRVFYCNTPAQSGTKK